MSFQGIDVRGTADRLMFRSLLLDNAGIVVTAGPTVLRLYEVQSAGTLKSFDFDDSTFKATALTTPTLAMTHQTGDAGTHNTGVWTVALATLTGFTVGNIYLGEVYNAGASPITQVREFQFGNGEGNLVVSSVGDVNINMEETVPNLGTVDTTGRALRGAIVSGATDLTSLTTGFASANPNNLSSYLKAMMRKDGTVPTGMGTYSPATDSLEADRELKDLLAGSGFATGTDSLAAIRDAIDNLLAPNIVTGGTSLSGTGFLSECVSLVRKAIDEPSLGPKYTDADIVEYIQAAFDDVVSDINVNSDHPVLVRHSITVVPLVQDYLLPANCGEVWRVAKINTTSGRPDWELWTSTEFSFAGYGFSLEGNKLRLLSKWLAGDTVEILYVPTGEPFIHKGTATNAAGPLPAASIRFASTVTDGTLDTRGNAYGGYMVRILSSNTGRVQERIVSSYDNATRIATVSPDWDPALDNTTVPVVYEVVPQYTRLVKHVVVLKTALTILSNEGNEKRMNTITTELRAKMRAMRMILEKMASRFPHRFNSDTVDNMDRFDYWWA